LRNSRFKNPYIDEIAKFEHVIVSEEDFSKEKSSFVFPVVLDIGCGNGEVLVDLASKNPGKFYLGFELQYKEVYRTASKIQRMSLKNCKVLRISGDIIPRLFDKGEIGDVNIFFPDPWPKTRQKKNRLIKKEYIKNLINKIKPGSLIKVKTDNDDYFMQILDVFHSLSKESYIELLELTRDYHHSSCCNGQYITPFERIFLRQGLLINYLCSRTKN